METVTLSRPFPPPLPVPKLDFAGRTTLSMMRLGMRLGSLVAPEKTSSYAHKIYFTPRRYAVPDRERKILAKARPLAISFKSRRNVAYPGGDLRGWSWGEGPVVIVAHGWESRGAWVTEPFLSSLLERGYRVVTLDMPGHGQSPGQQAEVLDFANAIKTAAKMVGPVHAVIAHSLGAAATSIAVTQGMNVNKLVYLGPVCWMLSLPARFCHILDLPQRCQEPLYKRLYKIYPESDWLNYSGDIISRQLKIPGLIFHDKGDAEVHHEGAIAIHQAWPNSELVLSEGLGHRRIIRDPSVIEKTMQFIG